MSEGAASAYAAINKAVLKAPPPAPVWSIWGAGFGGTNKTNGDLTVIGSRDLTSSAYGFAIGADYRAIPDSVVGFAMSGGGTIGAWRRDLAADAATRCRSVSTARSPGANFIPRARRRSPTIG